MMNKQIDFTTLEKHEYTETYISWLCPECGCFNDPDTPSIDLTENIDTELICEHCNSVFIHDDGDSITHNVAE